MKVKMLYASFISSLEDDINRWLSSNNRVKVIDIKYAVGDKDMGMYRYSAMIMYEV